MSRALLFLLFFFSWILSSGQSSFSVTASKERIVIGEPFRLEWETTVTEGTAPAWQLPDSIAHFEILEKPAQDTLRQGTELRIRQALVLTSWDSGRWNIPAFRAGKRTSKPIRVTVAFSDFDPKQDYHDIREILEVKPPKKSYWYWYLLLAALLAGFFFLLFPFRKKPKTEAPKTDPGVYKRSLDMLKALEKNIPDADPKPFYTGLVAVFRNYLHLRKGIYSSAQTSTELMRMVAQKGLDSGVEERLNTTLLESDGVKFARYPAGAAEKETALQNIKAAIMAMENKS
jgi:hypothetical protein